MKKEAKGVKERGKSGGGKGEKNRGKGKYVCAYRVSDSFWQNYVDIDIVLLSVFHERQRLILYRMIPKYQTGQRPLFFAIRIIRMVRMIKRIVKRIFSTLFVR